MEVNKRLTAKLASLPKNPGVYFHKNAVGEIIHVGKTSLEDYHAKLRKMMALIEGKRNSVEKEVERDMKQAAKAKDFEQAANYRNQLQTLQNLTRQVIFSDIEGKKKF